MKINISENSNSVEIAFKDNGTGLSKNIVPELLFDWGLSTADKRQGFGIGLYHIKLLVEEMQGNIYIDTNCMDGFRLVVTLKK
ncbi:sensor protein PhoQ [compost metagenome]